jgi:hypothetical protein
MKHDNKNARNDGYSEGQDKKYNCPRPGGDKCAAFQVSKLPLWRTPFKIRHDLLYPASTDKGNVVCIVQCMILGRWNFQTLG